MKNYEDSEIEISTDPEDHHHNQQPLPSESTKETFSDTSTFGEDYTDDTEPFEMFTSASESQSSNDFFDDEDDVTDTSPPTHTTDTTPSTPTLPPDDTTDFTNSTFDIDEEERLPYCFNETMFKGHWIAIPPSDVVVDPYAICPSAVRFSSIDITFIPVLQIVLIIYSFFLLSFFISVIQHYPSYSLQKMTALHKIGLPCYGRQLLARCLIGTLTNSSIVLHFKR